MTETAGPMERWLESLDGEGFGGWSGYEVLAFAREQDAIQRQLLQALVTIVDVVEQLIPEPSARSVADTVLFQARAAIAAGRGR